VKLGFLRLGTASAAVVAVGEGGASQPPRRESK